LGQPLDRVTSARRKAREFFWLEETQPVDGGKLLNHVRAPWIIEAARNISVSFFEQTKDIDIALVVRARTVRLGPS